MSKEKKGGKKAPKNIGGVAAKQNPKLAAQRRKALRSHYAAKYRVN